MTRDNAVATVLVVEDDVFQLMDTADYLECLGYEVIQALDAEQAIQLLHSRSDIRFLVTDIDMPGSMSGIDLARAVRNRWPPVEIIVMSGDVAPSFYPALSSFRRLVWPSRAG